MMTISRAALISLGIAVASIMLPTSSWAASFCDTEILSVAAAEVGDDLEFDLRVWNDDCGVGYPATWGSTEVELIRIDLTPETVTSDCLNHEPDHDGFYDSTETYNLGSVFGQGGVYQLVVRPYSSDSCSGDRGRRDRETFNISDPDGSGSSFLVSTFFGDGNPASFDVSIECNTGLPLTQTATISGTDPVKFIVEDFVSGTMTCTIVADGVPGYSQSLLDGQDNAAFAARYAEERGDAFVALGRYDEARAAYQAALDEAQPTVDQGLIQLKLMDLPDEVGSE